MKSIFTITIEEINGVTAAYVNCSGKRGTDVNVILHAVGSLLKQIEAHTVRDLTFEELLPYVHDGYVDQPQKIELIQ